MANGGDWHDNYMWGIVAMLFTGIYTGFVKHIYGHSTIKDVEAQQADLVRLKAAVQYKDNCEQIVKRLDEHNRQTHEMLGRILDKLDKLQHNGS